MAEVSGVEAPGPLGPFVAGFAAELSRQGYKPKPVGKQIGLVAALSSWLAAEGLAASELVVGRGRALLRGAPRGGAHLSVRR